MRPNKLKLSTLPIELLSKLSYYIKPREVHKLSFLSSTLHKVYSERGWREIIVEGTSHNVSRIKKALNQGAMRVVSLNAFADPESFHWLNSHKVETVYLHINTTSDVAKLFNLTKTLKSDYPNLHTVNICSIDAISFLSPKDHRKKAMLLKRLEYFTQSVKNVRVKMSSSPNREPPSINDDPDKSYLRHYNGKEISVRNENYSCFTSVCYQEFNIGSFSFFDKLTTFRINPGKGVYMERYINACQGLTDLMFPALKYLSVVHHCACTLSAMNNINNSNLEYCEAAVQVSDDDFCVTCYSDEDEEEPQSKVPIRAITALTVYPNHQQFCSTFDESKLDARQDKEEIACDRLAIFDFPRLTKLDLSNVEFTCRFSETTRLLFEQVDYTKLEYFAVALFTPADYFAFLELLPTMKCLKTLNIEYRHFKDIDSMASKTYYPHIKGTISKMMHRVTTSLKKFDLRDSSIMSTINEVLEELKNEMKASKGEHLFQIFQEIMETPTESVEKHLNVIKDRFIDCEMTQYEDPNQLRRFHIMHQLWPLIYSEAIYAALTTLPNINIVRIKNGVKTLGSPRLYFLVNTHKTLRSIHILDSGKELHRIIGSETNAHPDRQMKYLAKKRFYWPYIYKKNDTHL